MTYYAVTNDPNELMHFGVKGMKWGVRKDRSESYRRARAKLGGIAKSGIKKAQTKWKAYNSPAAKKARSQLHALNKQEKKFQRAMQDAREGRLSYKNLSDDEVRRITDRLNLEKVTRSLSGAEKSNFGRRLRTAVGNGVITGIERGTATAMDKWVEGRMDRRNDRKRYSNSVLSRQGRYNRRHDRKDYRDEQRKLDDAFERQVRADDIKFKRGEKSADMKAQRDAQAKVREQDAQIRYALSIQKANTSAIVAAKKQQLAEARKRQDAFDRAYRKETKKQERRVAKQVKALNKATQRSTEQAQRVADSRRLYEGAQQAYALANNGSLSGFDDAYRRNRKRYRRP